MSGDEDHYDINDYRDDGRLVKCYACGKAVNEDAERCHHCGTWFEGGAWYACRKNSKWANLVWPIAAILVILALTWYAWAWFM